MNSNLYSGLRFDRRVQLRLSHRAIWLIISVATYLLAWNVLDYATLFWLGIPIFLVLSWLSSYSWKVGLKAIDQVLHRLENL